MVERHAHGADPVSVRRLALMSRPAIRAQGSRQGGQGLVEFAMLVPAFLLILLGMLEFGFAFNHNITLEYATREGARAGAAAANGTMKDSSCVNPATGVTTAFTSADVDPLVIAAVQRVLKSPGSMIDMSQVVNIKIYQVQADGTVTGLANTWPLAIGAGANVPCSYPAQKMDFSAPATVNWSASTRPNGSTPDSIGVSITYTYQFRSALGSILRFFGGSGVSQLTMTDKTVMALEPTP
jgi:Flp pilus assembly protein TadG